MFSIKYEDLFFSRKFSNHFDFSLIFFNPNKIQCVLRATKREAASKNQDCKERRWKFYAPHNLQYRSLSVFGQIKSKLVREYLGTEDQEIDAQFWRNVFFLILAW